MKTRRFITALKRYLTVLLLGLPLLLSSTVAAMSDSQRKAFNTGALYANTEESSCVGFSSSLSTTKLTSGGVYVLGDSITESAKAKYIEVFGLNGLTATVNASANRSIEGSGNDGDSGLEAIEKDKAIISDPNTKAIVVALGTNGVTTATNISTVLTKLRALSSARIYWVNTIVINKVDILQRIKNANVAIDNEAKNKTITPISWFKTVDPNSDPLNPTGNEKDLNGYIVDADVHVHPTSLGVGALVDLVSSTVINNASSNSQTVKSNSGCSCSVEVSTLLNGNDNQEKIWNYFIGKGLSANAVAALMGNIHGESAFNPHNVQNKSGRPDADEMPYDIDPTTKLKVPASWIRGSWGYGLIQWTTASRQDALLATAGTNRLSGDLDVQLEYMWSELNSRFYDQVLAKIREPGITREEATDAVTLGYVKPGPVNTSDETNPARISKLNEYKEWSRQSFNKYSGLSPSSGLSSSGNCANITGPGEDTKYVDGFTIYSQLDNAWKNKPYGTSTIGDSGCGPAAMAMIITNLTGTAVSPVETTAYANERGMYITDVGSNWLVAPILATQWGLKATPFSNFESNERTHLLKNVGTITASLQAGALIVGAGGGAKPFSVQGHYIIIRGVTSSGKFKIADSWYPDTADQEWDPEQILSQMSVGSMYAITK